MKKTQSCACTVLFMLGLLPPIRPVSAAPPSTPPSRSTWVTAYYPVWEQESGSPSPAEIDYSALSCLTHFAAIPRADGTIEDTPGKTITLEESRAVLSPAHAAGRQVLLCVGGDGTLIPFRAAIGDASRTTLVNTLVQMVVSRGYDGLDIDFEPLEDTDTANYAKFITALRAKMDAANPQLLLTAAVARQPAVFAGLQSKFDQINIMTYDLSGPWQGFKTWHNGPLFDAAGQTMPGGGPYPSVRGDVQQFMRAGVAKAKIGIGVAFYGDIWSGATGPRQSIQGTTATEIAYHDIIDKYYQPARSRWDAQAHAPYLTIDAPNPKDRKFISYDDERLCAEKVTYVRRQGLGGVIIWELGDGYRAGQPKGQKDPLLQAVKRAWLSPLPAAPHKSE